MNTFTVPGHPCSRYLPKLPPPYTLREDAASIYLMDGAERTQLLKMILRWLSHDDARISALEREVQRLKRQVAR